MALYYDAVSILTADAEQGSLKSRVYSGNVTLKSKPAQVFALITESAKYDAFLAEVVDSAGLLTQEPKLSPLLSVLLLHDYFFSKKGIAASPSHALRRLVERHKARLQAEFTKARLRRQCGSVEALKEKLTDEHGARSGNATEQPRWIRINRLKATIETVLEEAFDGYKPASSLSELIYSESDAKLYWIDPNVPDLLALPPGSNLTKTNAYETSQIILQDKASCFPAHLLIGAALSTTSPNKSHLGDVIDACAAPGNKTTHLASIIASYQPPFKSKSASRHRIFACERNPVRSKILQSMVSRSAAADIEVLPRQDFLSLDPQDPRFQYVTHLLLDPSCSGSGILNRKDVPVLTLPATAPPPTSQPKTQKSSANDSRSNKKQKLSHSTTSSSDTINPPTEAATHSEVDTDRLAKLSNLQSLIVEHALSFPAATHITYSTCSIHTQENEEVVARVLRSDVAQRRGWTLLRRRSQVEGLREWAVRGTNSGATDRKMREEGLSDWQVQACIRCQPGDEKDGTMGFFVCCFVRDTDASHDHGTPGTASGDMAAEAEDAEDKEKEKDLENANSNGNGATQQQWDEEWSGFSDQD